MLILNWIIAVGALAAWTDAKSIYYDGENRPYEFGFSIDGNQHRHETKDEKGIIMGEFGFITADGVYHVTVYATDEEGRFKIISMKNLRKMPLMKKTDVKSVQMVMAPAATTTTTTTTAPTTRAQLALSTTAPLLTTPKPSNIKSCSSCHIPTQAPPAISAPQPVDNRATVGPIAQRPDIRPPFTPAGPLAFNNTANRLPAAQFGLTMPVPGAVDGRQPEAPARPTTTASFGQPGAPSFGAGPAGSPGAQQAGGALGGITSVGGAVGQDVSQTSGKVGGAPAGGQSTAPGSPQSSLNMASMSDPAFMEQLLTGLLYRFNYTVGYHGHSEKGDRSGNKEGNYFFVGRDGYKRVVDYKANEFGYQPRIRLERVQPEDVPTEEHEKNAGLKGQEFVWYNA